MSQAAIVKQYHGIMSKTPICQWVILWWFVSPSLFFKMHRCCAERYAGVEKLSLAGCHLAPQMLFLESE